MSSPMLRLDSDNSLINGSGQTVVLKGVGLGGTFQILMSSIDLLRVDEYGKLHYWLSFPRVSNP